jgi:hypothetical protein
LRVRRVGSFLMHVRGATIQDYTFHKAIRG